MKNGYGEEMKKKKQMRKTKDKKENHLIQNKKYKWEEKSIGRINRKRKRNVKGKKMRKR